MHDQNASQTLPVVVIGAGPVGLAAAAHLLRRGLTPRILEAGEEAGSQVARWGHVRMFSPWKYNIDPEAARRLEAAGWNPPPDDDYPTGRELVDRYLRPLAALPELASSICYGCRVTAVGKRGHDRLRDGGRSSAPFVVHYRDRAGDGQILARAVIDASGTLATPNPLGAGGIEAPGEQAARSRIFYGLPDIRGRDRASFAGRKVLVIGGGDSAFTALTELAEVMKTDPATRVVWAIRGDSPRFGGGKNDQLPERGALGDRVRAWVREGRVELVTGFQVTEIQSNGASLEVVGADSALSEIEAIVAATGFRPDHGLARELRLSLDPGSESASALGPLIDPNIHSCGSVPPHGVDELEHPDSGYYIVGMKSYGRAPTFLLLTGYEQVRSVTAALAGDWAAARNVRLVLPETGVCSIGPAPAVEAPPAATCCGDPPPIRGPIGIRV